MKLLKIRLKGNTIVEVLIALTITSFCTGLAVLIYLNIQKGSLPFFKIKAIELAEFYMNKSIEEQSFNDDTFKEEEFVIKKTIAPHELFADCYLVHIIVFDPAKKKITELERTVHQGD